MSRFNVGLYYRCNDSYVTVNKQTLLPSCGNLKQCIKDMVIVVYTCVSYMQVLIIDYIYTYSIFPE